MDLMLIRFHSTPNETLGILSDVTDINTSKFLCFTLEDEYREVKVAGKTRIPSGVYEVKFRNEGGFHGRYLQKFPEFHRGMLHLQNVPGFKYVLIHIGNTSRDTRGCILTGDGVACMNGNYSISKSTIAYVRLYKYIVDNLSDDEEITLKIVDFENLKGN